MKMRDMLKRLGREDSGIALFIVVGAIALVTIVAVGAYTTSQQSVLNSRRAVEQTRAFQAANSGIDVALARISVNGFDPNAYPFDGTLDDGSTYQATVEATSNAEYICVSTGTDTSGKTETIKVRFFYLNLWNMNLAAGAGDALGGGAVKGTTSVYGPFYVRGTVELSSNSTVERGPFFIKEGDLYVSGSGTMGSEGPIDLYVTGSVNGKPSSINIRSQSNAVPDISLPDVDQAYLDEAWQKAKAQSVDNKQGDDAAAVANLECVGGDPASYQTMNPPNSGWTRNKAPGASAHYKTVCPAAGPSAPGTGVSGLTIGGTGSWGSWSGDGHYTTTSRDDFAYDDANNILTVEGTVYVDGPITITEDVLYQGNGTLIANGDITIQRSWRPNRPSDNYYMDATHSVGLVTPSNIVVQDQGNNTGKDPNGVPDLCGAFFASNDFSMVGNQLVKGSVLAGSISFNHANEHLVTDPNLPTYLPEGMPGSGAYILTKGAWVR